MTGHALAFNLRRCRDEKGLSQAEVAKRAGISRSVYQGIESGGKPPASGEIVARLASVLGVKTAELMTEVRPLKAVRFCQPL
jgi:transcriptional regulator with XRE-family HTH domain